MEGHSDLVVHTIRGWSVERVDLRLQGEKGRDRCAVNERLGKIRRTWGVTEVEWFRSFALLHAGTNSKEQ